MLFQEATLKITIQNFCSSSKCILPVKVDKKKSTHTISNYFCTLLVRFPLTYLSICRSLSKMVDKVQAKSEESETSIFHHELMKLLVLDELQRLGIDWSSFLFVSVFELDALTPSKTPKPNKIPSPLAAE